MSQTERKTNTRDLSKNKEQREQQRIRAVKAELARNNPKIDNNIIKGYN